MTSSKITCLITVGQTSHEADLARRPIGGRELLAHAIDQARSVPAIGAIRVACGDLAIAEIARREKAAVELSDLARSPHTALAYLRDAELDRAIFLDALAPFRDASAIASTLDLLARPGVSRVESASPVRGTLWRKRASRIEPATKSTRADDSELLATHSSILALRAKPRTGGKTLLLSTPDAFASFRVDSFDALDLAEAAYFARRRAALRPLLRRVRLLILDFDGVMTNNQVMVMEDGREGVLCNRSDGLGVGMLKNAGVTIAVLSAETNPVVTRRCEKLAIECLQGVKDKLAGLKRLLDLKGIDAGDAAYVGNDINDLPCMDYITARGGVSIGVADSHPDVRSRVQGLTRLPGGYGAVREVIDWLLEVRQANAESAHA